MAKLVRVYQQQFGLNGATSHFGVFGSAAANSPSEGTFTKDPNSIQSLDAFTNNGWAEAVAPGGYVPPLEDMNGLFFLIFRQIAYLFQSGVAEWDPSTPYYTYSIVKDPNSFNLYGSLVDNNIGNALPNQTNNGYWQFLTPSSVAAGIVSDYAGGSIPFGYLFCDGSSYSTGSYPALFAAIGYTFGGSGGNFNVPDARGRATIGAGQGGGLTNRSLGQTLGEETHTLVTGEIPSHNHSLNDPGHVHTINGSSSAFRSTRHDIDLSFGAGNQMSNGMGMDSATTGISMGNTGGNGAHNNMQPSLVLLKIIKY